MPAMRFEFFDVGMGDATLIVMGNTPATQQLALVDFGVQPFTKFKIGADDAGTYLVREIGTISRARKRPLPFLDHLFITHFDQDHYNRILPLINADYSAFGYGLGKLSIGHLTYGGARARYGVGGNNVIDQIAPHVIDPIADLADRQCSIVNPNGSVTRNWSYAGTDIYLLSSNFPTTAGYLGNPKSLCLMFAGAPNNKVILMGDAEQEVEAQIIQNFQHAAPGFLNAYGLKLGHHGSLNGTSAAWINAVLPQAIFASGDFVWAHPYCAAIDRVIAAGTLMQGPEHWYCCGRSGKEYFNHETQDQVCPNLWYVVKDAAGESMIDHDGDVSIQQQGMTLGVQWELVFNGSAAPEINRTDTWHPVPPT